VRLARASLDGIKVPFDAPRRSGSRLRPQPQIGRDRSWANAMTPPWDSRSTGINAHELFGHSIPLRGFNAAIPALALGPSKARA